MPSAAALEVKTDAPMPPAVSIISPTPRAFTFPNVLDGPTPRAFAFPANVQSTPPEPSPSTPSTSPSPFEPDLSALHITHRTESPVAVNPFGPFETSQSGPITIAHRRRGSACSSISVERKPKRGDEDYIKRPENAFILFRRECCLKKNAEEAASATNGETQGQRRQRQADLSKTISQQWRSLSSEERKYWDDLAKQRKKEHEEMYPWYVYQPTRSKEKGKKSTKSKSQSRSGRSRGASTSSAASSVSSVSTAESEDFYDYSDSETSSTSYMVPSRRNSSARTPPPMYGGIKIPTLLEVPRSDSPSMHTMQKSQSNGLMGPPPLPNPYQQFMASNEQLHHMQFGRDSLEITGQVPEYTADLHTPMFNVDIFDPSNQTQPQQQQQMGDKRSLTQLSIPQSTPDALASQQVSPTQSLSPGSMPVTPQRMGYLSPTAAIAMAAGHWKARPTNIPESPKPVHSEAEWDAFDLPSWALSTFYSGGVAQNNNSVQVGQGMGMGANGMNFELLGDGSDIDMSSLPPFTIDLPTHSGEIDGMDTMDPLFGLQFRFEDLLDPSQL